MEQINQHAQANSPFLEIAKRHPESERFFQKLSRAYQRFSPADMRLEVVKRRDPDSGL